MGIRHVSPRRGEFLVLKQCVSAIGAALIVGEACAVGDGSIVIQRELQPRVAFRQTMVPDPNPISVNPNVSAQVNHQLRGLELSDGDFAHVISGQRLGHSDLGESDLPGLDGITSSQGARLPGISAGRAGSAGNGISSQVNRSVQRGLAPLQKLTGGR